MYNWSHVSKSIWPNRVFAAITYPGIPYPVVQKRSVYFKPQVQLLLFFTVDLFNGPFLELVRRDCARFAGRTDWKEERQSTGRGCMVIGRGNLEVDSNEFQVRLWGEVQISTAVQGIISSACHRKRTCHFRHCGLNEGRPR